jgi:hypothetical protein
MDKKDNQKTPEGKIKPVDPYSYTEDGMLQLDKQPVVGWPEGKRKFELQVGKDYRTRGGWKARVIWNSISGGSKAYFYVIHKPGTEEESVCVTHAFNGFPDALLAVGFPPDYGQHPADIMQEWIVERPRVGDIIFVPSDGDFTGGEAKISWAGMDISGGKEAVFVRIKEFPGHSYNWKYLGKDQEELAKEYEGKKAGLR